MKLAAGSMGSIIMNCLTLKDKYVTPF